MNGFLLASALFSLITCLAHLFWGGYEIVNSLLKAPELEEVPKLTTYYCWHIVTLVLLAMTCAYAYVSLQPDFPLTVAITSIAAVCAILSMALIVTRHLKPLDYPQWAFFIPITVFGVLGLIAV